MTVIKEFFVQFLDLIAVLYYVYRGVFGYCHAFLPSDGFTERHLNVIVDVSVHIVINSFFLFYVTDMDVYHTILHILDV